MPSRSGWAFAALTAVVVVVLGACSGSRQFDGGVPGQPGASLTIPAPIGSGIGLQPPPIGGFPVQPGGGGNPVGGNAGVPDWVRPGMRISWYAAAASVAQSRYSWVEDPTGPWEDPKTGKRYRRTDEEGGEGQGGASGDGISQIDVLAVEGSDVVLTSNIFTINRGNAEMSYIWTPAAGAKVPGNVVDGAWMHPALLAQYLNANIGGVLVLRGPYALNGVQYNAVSFVTNSGSAYTSYTYDSQTGILLSATTSTGGATQPIAAPGENPPVGNSQLTITRYLGMRQRNLPGTGQPNPGWVGQGGTLQYAGTYFWTNPVDPSSGAFQYPMTYSVSLQPGGATWMAFRAQSVIQGFTGAQPEQAGVTAGNGGIWYDPASLASFQAGQILDRDPITGEQTVVSSAGPGGGGRSVVAVDTQMAGIFQRRAYESDGGTLVAYDLQQPTSGTSIHVDLQGR